MELESSLDEYEIKEDPVTWTSSARWIHENYTSLSALSRRLPIVKWLPGYRAEEFAGDVVAGLSLAFTLIPQAIGQALIAKVPITYGLYTGLCGCLIYGVFGSCKDCNLGPTAIMSLFSGFYLGIGNYNYVIILNMLSGIIQLIVGALNCGFLVDFIPFPVISSYINCATLVVILSVAPQLFGITAPQANTDCLYVSIVNFFGNFLSLRLSDTLLGFICIFFILGLKYSNQYCKTNITLDEEQDMEVPSKMTIDGDSGEVRSMQVKSKRQKAKRAFLFVMHWLSLSANLLVVIFCMIAAYLMRSFSPFILAKSAPPGLPTFTPPNFTVITTEDIGGHLVDNVKTFGDILRDLTPGWIVVPFLSALGAVSVPKVIERSSINPMPKRLTKDQVKVKIFDPSQEIFAHGVGNLIGCCFQTLPMGLSFGRSFILHTSGVQTQFNQFIASLVLLIAISPLCGPAFHYIPVACVAAVIICAITPVMKPFDIVTVYRTDTLDFILYIATFLLTVFIGLGYGILLGIAISLGMLLAKVVRPVIQTESGLTSLEDDDDLSELGPNFPYLVVKPTQNIYYPAMEYFESSTIERFNQLLENYTYSIEATRGCPAATKLVLVVDGEHLFKFDATFLVSTRNFATILRKKQVTLVFYRIRLPIRTRLQDLFMKEGLAFSHSKSKESLIKAIKAIYRSSLPGKRMETTFTQTSLDSK